MVIQSINGIYMHCAWATSEQGTDFSLTEFDDATYRGVYYDNSPAESTEPISYKWIEIGDGAEDDAIEAENAASYAQAVAGEAETQTIANNNNLQSTQYATDEKTSNPNELIGTNQGTSNWTASAGLTISAVTGTIYDTTDDAVNYLHVVCDAAGANYIYYNADILRAKLSDLTDGNAFTFSADIKLSTVVPIDIAVQDTDGTDTQLDFGTIDTDLIPVPEESADGLWTYCTLTAETIGGVSESAQVLYIDLSNMSAGDTLDIANLKVEGGAMATPWRASLDEVAQIANQAYQVAGNTNQHFWFVETGTDTGAHITEVTQEEFLQDPTNGGGNLLARSNGIALREGLAELATLQQSGLEVKTYNAQGNSREIAHLGYGPGTDESGGTSDAPYYLLGYRASGSSIGNLSTVFGNLTEASGFASVSMGANTKATGPQSVAEGLLTQANGEMAHAEGFLSIAGGNGAHAEGYANSAGGDYSHAEGYNNTAAGNYSHVEGTHSYTNANAENAHAQNLYTIAASANQTAIGKYNKSDSANKYAFIIGNGTSSARSNALTVDWSGNVEASGDITDGSGNVLSNAVVEDSNGDITISRDVIATRYLKGEDARLELDTTATSGTDYELCTAISSLGWTSDVIE